jgi:hypothetical protein
MTEAPLDNVEAHNRESDELLGVFQKRFPRTYRLLDGSRFQVPASRKADYPKYGHAIYIDAEVLVQGAMSRLVHEPDPDLWDKVSREFMVTNEWLKGGRTTLFVERELGEALQRTDLPEGFVPDDLRWRWNAFRLILPAGMFRCKGARGESYATCVTVAKTFKDRPLDFHPALSQDAKASLGGEPLGGILVGSSVEGDAKDALTFCIQHMTDPTHKRAALTYGGCKLDDRTLRALAEECRVSKDSCPSWTPDLSVFMVGIKRFLFNALLYMGSLPEEYEPEKVLRPFLEKKGRWKPELKAARFLGQEAYRPAQHPSGKEHEPTGRKLPGHWRCGHWVRQAYGPQWSLRKLTWVQAYKTLGPSDDPS